VKVVEDSEIYNFSIHHLEHCYVIFWSLARSKQGTSTRSRAGRRRARRRRAAACRCPAPRCSGTQTASPGRSFPMPCAHRGASCPMLPVRACYGPLVRPPSVRPLAPEVPPSIRWALAGARVAYKAAAAPCINVQALPTTVRAICRRH
jgi:hypothetical protein